ncbi:MAG: VOC family protein [Candidatus Melainabacteria bacterium]|nr:VOC family protein [Candidatus Melainabacteria bacterium]
MQKITPHLWFDKEAVEAAKFYTSVFKDSKVKNVTKIYDTPSGDCDIVSFQLMGQDFMSISAGPLFKFTPAISFLVLCNKKEEVDDLWKKLSDKGKVLMEIDKYPWSERYGWLNDKYGLSWQIILTDEKVKQRIVPSLMFTQDKCGKAEEAINLYVSVFDNSKIEKIIRYGKDEKPEKEGNIKYASFTLEGQEFTAMDSGHKHNFTFNEAISFIVECKNQEEVDYYWNKLSAFPESEQCGWIKDKYGVSWQIVPKQLGELINNDKSGRVVQAMLKMKKLDVKKLEDAYKGE